MLEVSRLSVSYGQLRAVAGISLAVAAGEIVSLTGANGAGKSSVLDGISGVAKVAGGSVVFNGREISNRPPHHPGRRGLVQVPEGRRLFATLSVRENLLLGAGPHCGRRFSNSDFGGVVEFFPALQDKLHLSAASLSGGEAQMLALARGLMAKPKCLLLDEPSLGLSPAATEDVYRLIAGMRPLNIGILLVEQNVELGLSVSDRGYLLESGRIVLAGTPQQLLSDPHLVSRYLGAGENTPNHG
ncbi:MAG: ABC transporter ATP-binding protein [Gammaproteobacteria bacterium]|nr:ABC transporter ATP-binding protein [Gammaproteobacteria bacterium]MDD9814499.1 ABC transporter ATP-binding protein [Gammaproteobacteria bacterium]